MSDIQTEERSRTDEAKEAASNVAGQAATKAGNVADEAKAQAGELAGTAAQKASDVVGTARDELRQRATSEAESVGQRLHAVADELRAMSRASTDNGGTVAPIVGDLAERVDHGAQRLANGDVDQVLEDVKRFARNRPGTFLLGAAGAGFVVGRLLRSVDLNEVKEAVTSSSEGQSSVGNGQPPTAVSPATPPTTAIGSGISSPTPPSANPESTPTPDAPAAPGAPI